MIAPRIAILVPVINRPQNVAPLVASVRRATPEPHVLLFIVSQNDRAEIAAIKAAGAEYLVGARQQRQRGDYARKINRGLAETTAPLLFTGADDIDFRPGWLAAATAKLRPGIGVVGTNDLGNPQVLDGDHSTHSVVTRDYAMEFGTFDRRGIIYHEGYDHNFVDVELVATAKRRGAWAFARDSYVEHLHPSWGKRAEDNLYKIGRARWVSDQRMCARRLDKMRAAIPAT